MYTVYNYILIIWFYMFLPCFLCQKFGVYKLVMLVRRYQLRAADACCTFPVLKVTDPSLLSVTATSSFRTDLQWSQEESWQQKERRRLDGSVLASVWWNVRLDTEFKRRVSDFFWMCFFFFWNGMIVPDETWYRMVGVFRWWVLQLLEASGGAGAPAPTSLAGVVGWVVWRDFQIHKKK